MVASDAPKRSKLSRRKKAKARQTLNKAFMTVLSELENDTFLKNHLVSERKAKNKYVRVHERSKLSSNTRP